MQLMRFIGKRISSKKDIKPFIRKHIIFFDKKGLSVQGKILKTSETGFCLMDKTTKISRQIQYSITILFSN